MTKEDQEVGQIGRRVYWMYMQVSIVRGQPHMPSLSACVLPWRAGGWRWGVQAYGLRSCAALVLCWASEQSVRVLTQWWLSQWTASEGRRQFSQKLGQAPCPHVHHSTLLVCALRFAADVNHRFDTLGILCWCVAGLSYNNPRAKYIGGYLGFAIAFVILTMLRALLNLYSAWGASGKIYRQSLSVWRLP